MLKNKDEITEIIREYLTENLTFCIEDGDYYSGRNDRTLVVSLEGDEFWRASFDVKNREEYGY